MWRWVRLSLNKPYRIKKGDSGSSKLTEPWFLHLKMGGVRLLIGY